MHVHPATFLHALTKHTSVLPATLCHLHNHLLTHVCCPCSTNQTSSATPTTNTTLTIATPCDLKTTFVLTLASKVPSTLTFLNKTFTLPVNPLTSCPASRCVATATSAFEGLPVFNLFKSVGVVPNLTSSNVLNFSFTPALPKVCSQFALACLLACLCFANAIVT